jgi:hypothetical protein
MRLLLCVLVLTGTVITLFGCEEEKVVAVDDLYGLWVVYGAERNGHPTETVKGAQFDIRESGEMTTDITGEEVVGDFTFAEGKITHHTETGFVYTVSDVKADSMQLQFDIKGLAFTLDLARQQTE